MRILLIFPGTRAALEEAPHLGLMHVISYLRAHGFPDASYADYSAISDAKLARTIRSGIDVVGVSCSTPTRFRALKVAKLVKSVDPRLPVIMGGIHASFVPEQIIKNYPQIDIVVAGEGEQTTLEVVQTLQSGGDLGEVAGLTYRRGGEVVATAPREKIADLDSLPFAEYIDHYSNIYGGGKRKAEIMSSRGCGWACSYCAVPAFWGRRRDRSVANVVDEVDYLVRRRGVGYIHFVDDSFTADMDRTRQICEEILHRGIRVKWRCTSRANCMSRELMEIMQRSGCIRISVGVESGDPDILQAINKQVTIYETADLFAWAHDLGIITEACFIVGSPGETQESINRTEELICKIKPKEFNVSSATYLFPGTPLFRKLRREGIVDDSLWLRKEAWIPYLEEQTPPQLARWQMQLICACARNLSPLQRLRYYWRSLRTVEPGRLARAASSLLALGGSSSGQRSP